MRIRTRIILAGLFLLLASLGLLLTASAEEAPEAGWISVKDYGAVGDGVTNDTDAINLAIAMLREGETLYFPEGTYLVHTYEGAHPVIRVHGKRNVTLRLHENTVIQLDVVPDHSTGSEDRNYMIQFKNSENVTLTGGKFIGDRLTYQGTVRQDHSFAIHVADSTGITVRDVEIEQMRGDGIYVSSEQYQDGVWGVSRNITIDNCKIHDCFRNGISLIIVDGCVIRNTEIYNISGGMPQAGIDIEAQYANTVNRNVTIEDCHFHDNGSWSVAVAGEAENITFLSSVFEDRFTAGPESRGLRFSECTMSFVGISGKDCTIENSTLRAVCLYGGEVTCTNCTFDGRDWIPYRVLVTKSDGTSVGKFENCTFYGRGLCALGGCIVFCHTPPASLEFTDCDFKSCGLIPFLGHLSNVERTDCFFGLGPALWACIIGTAALVTLLILRARLRKRPPKHRRWVCK